MSEYDIVHAWKDPENAERATAPAHPSGDADLADLRGGLNPYLAPGTEKLGSYGCCPSYPALC